MKIRFKHTWIALPLKQEYAESNRRFTICIVEEDTGVQYVGQAICNPKDQFNKRLGRKISLTDAIRTLPKEKRTKVWEEYFKTYKAPNAK